MKNNLKITKSLTFIFVGLVVLGVFSCAKETPMYTPASDTNEVVKQEEGSTNTSLRSFDAARAAVSEIALEYCDNAKIIMYATSAFERPSENVSYENLLDNSSEPKENPMSLKFNSLEIEDETTKRRINFFDLPQEQKEVFTDLLLLEEAKSMTAKIEAVPALKKFLLKENFATSRVIEREGLSKLQVGTISSGLRSAEEIVPVNEKGKFFKMLSEEIEKELSGDVPQTRSLGISFNYPKVPVDRVKKAWRRSSRRGDFVVAIPNHFAPWIYLNAGKNVKFSIGHAGIINSKIDSNIKDEESVTIEAYKKEGVRRLTISEWDTPHYVMGVQKVKWVWKWKWFKSGLYKETKPVSNPGALADWANKYVGRRYVYAHEFFTAKWAAPKRFTCTTLVWWCAKKAYGINVSGWYSPLVTPSGLLTDDETYVRENVL